MINYHSKIQRKIASLKNFDKAYDCFMKASEYNRSSWATETSYYYLEKCYYWGKSIQQDKRTAYKYFMKDGYKGRAIFVKQSILSIMFCGVLLGLLLGGPLGACFGALTGLFIGAILGDIIPYAVSLPIRLLDFLVEDIKSFILNAFFRSNENKNNLAKGHSK